MFLDRGAGEADGCVFVVFSFQQPPPLTSNPCVGGLQGANGGLYGYVIYDGGKGEKEGVGIMELPLRYVSQCR